MAFLQHNDSIADLASLLDSKHDAVHNPALDYCYREDEKLAVEVSIGNDTTTCTSKAAEETKLDDNIFPNNAKHNNKVEESFVSNTDKELSSSRSDDSPAIPTAPPYQHETKNKRGSNSSQKSTTAASSSYTNTSNYYHFFDPYDPNFDPYAPTTTESHERSSFLACLFPWLFMSGDDDDDDDDQNQQHAENHQLVRVHALDEHDIPSNPQVAEESLHGEKFLNDHEVSSKEDASFLQSRNASKEHLEDQNGDSKDSLEKSRSSMAKKGILKKSPSKNRLPRNATITTTTSSTTNTRTHSSPATKADVSLSNSRRTLFSTMYTAAASNKSNRMPKINHQQEQQEHRMVVQFSPMARVLIVKSNKNMSMQEKAKIWWQKSDYDDFKKTGRLVTKAMLQGGSEVWLMTNPSWSNNNSNNNNKMTKENNIMQLASKDKNYSGNNDVDDDDDSDKVGNNKWWCKFGHSRRGLEHIVSPDEGKDRQRNVRKSIAVVLEEQRRQKRLLGRMDEDKIRQVYIRYNSWARELCLAAGASDAEAVRSNFQNQGRCRNYYLLERQNSAEVLSMMGCSSSNSNSSNDEEEEEDTCYSGEFSSNIHHLPDFMKRVRSDELASPGRLTQTTTTTTTCEAIHDASAHANRMTKKAAGFGTEEHTDMSAVLSGMGVV